VSLVHGDAGKPVWLVVRRHQYRELGGIRFVSEESDLFTGKVRPFEVDRRRDRLEKLELSLDVA
jgi:hypothetical protein